MGPTISQLNYSYKKPDANVWVLNLDDIPIAKSKINDQQIVHLTPLSVGGNHKHPRTEWFIGIGELYFVWLDADGQLHEEPMHPDGQILLFEVPPFLPHAVANKSGDRVGMLFEMADGKMEKVEPVKVYQL